MKKTFFTKNGDITRELTNAEIIQAAANGDVEAQFIIAKEEWKTAGQLQDKINVLAKLHGLI